MSKPSAPREPHRQTSGLRTKESRHVDRRSVILGAARRLLLKQGIEHFAIAEVAELAGLSKPSVYYYFASKEEIVTALGEQIAKEESDVLERALAGATSSIDALSRMLRAYIDHYAGNLDAFRILYVWPQALGIQNRFPAELNPLSLPTISRISDWLREEQALGQSDLDPQLFVVNAWAAAHGLISIVSSRGILAMKHQIALASSGAELSRCLQVLAACAQRSATLSG